MARNVFNWNKIEKCNVIRNHAISFRQSFERFRYIQLIIAMSGIGNKRMAAESSPSGPPEKKAGVEDSGTTVETIKLGGVSSTVCEFACFVLCYFFTNNASELIAASEYCIILFLFSH